MDLLKSENDKNVTMEFHEACKTGDIKKVKFLLSKKEKINVNQLDEEDTLSNFVRKRNADIVKTLLSLGVNVNEQGFGGITPLHWACARADNLTVAKILIQNGANIDAIVTGLKQSPLYFASEYGNVGAVKLLLENGCKTGVRNRKGMTALEISMQKDFVDILKMFAFHDKDV